MAYEFSCRTAGAVGCNWKVRAGTQDEVMARVAEHAQKVHKVKKVSNTIADYARSTTRQV